MFGRKEGLIKGYSRLTKDFLVRGTLIERSLVIKKLDFSRAYQKKSFQLSVM
jgi:hypothetical protein